MPCSLGAPREPPPSVAALRKAFYDADAAGRGDVETSAVRRRWVEAIGNAAADESLLLRAGR